MQWATLLSRAAAYPLSIRGRMNDESPARTHVRTGEGRGETGRAAYSAMWRSLTAPEIMLSPREAGDLDVDRIRNGVTS